jgi:hypothetical protein
MGKICHLGGRKERKDPQSHHNECRHATEMPENHPFCPHFMAGGTRGTGPPSVPPHRKIENVC